MTAVMVAHIDSVLVGNAPCSGSKSIQPEYRGKVTAGIDRRAGYILAAYW